MVGGNGVPNKNLEALHVSFQGLEAGMFERQYSSVFSTCWSIQSL